MKIKIYLNDGEYHWEGFDPAKAELTMVFSFEKAFRFLVIPEDILEWCFHEFNVGDENEHAQQYRAKQLRGLSVGDVVVVGETAWACQSIGWKRITTDELQGAIIWDDEKENENG